MSISHQRLATHRIGVGVEPVQLVLVVGENVAHAHMRSKLLHAHRGVRVVADSVGGGECAAAAIRQVERGQDRFLARLGINNADRRVRNSLADDPGQGRVVDKNRAEVHIAPGLEWCRGVTQRGLEPHGEKHPHTISEGRAWHRHQHGHVGGEYSENGEGGHRGGRLNASRE